MYQFVAPKHKAPINLLANHMRLLTLIGHLGFVTDQQLDMLWSVCVHYPTTFTRSILRDWCSYGGILKKHEKSPSSKKSGIVYTAYSLTDNGKTFLLKNAFLSAEELAVDTVSVNSHNLQAIEVVVQGLYAASFKHHTLGTDTIAYTSPFNKQTITLANPYLNTAINFSSGGEEGPDGAGPSSCGTPLGAVPHGVVDIPMRRKKEEPGGQESKRLDKEKQQYMVCVPGSLLKAVNEIVTATVNPTASPKKDLQRIAVNGVKASPAVKIPNTYLAMVPTLTNQLSSWLVTGLVDINLVAVDHLLDSQIAINQQSLIAFTERLTKYQKGTQEVLQWVAITHLLTMGTLVAGNGAQLSSVTNVDNSDPVCTPSTVIPVDLKAKHGNAGGAKCHPSGTLLGSKVPSLEQTDQPSAGYSVCKADGMATLQASGNSDNVDPLGWSGAATDVFDELGLVPETPTPAKGVATQAAADSGVPLPEGVDSTSSKVSNPSHNLQEDMGAKTKSATHGLQGPLESGTVSDTSLPFQEANHDNSQAGTVVNNDSAPTIVSNGNDRASTTGPTKPLPITAQTANDHATNNQTPDDQVATQLMHTGIVVPSQSGEGGNTGVANYPTNDTGLPADDHLNSTTLCYQKGDINVITQVSSDDLNSHPAIIPTPPMFLDGLGPLRFTDIGWLPILQTSVTNQITMVGWWHPGVAICHPNSNHHRATMANARTVNSAPLSYPSSTQNGADFGAHVAPTDALSLADPLVGSLAGSLPNGQQTATKGHFGRTDTLGGSMNTVAGQGDTRHGTPDHWGELLPLGSLSDLQAGTIWVADWLPTSYHLVTNDGTKKDAQHDPYEARDTHNVHKKHGTYQNAFSGDVGRTEDTKGTDRDGNNGRTRGIGAGDAKDINDVFNKETPLRVALRDGDDPRDSLANHNDGNTKAPRRAQISPTDLPNCALQQLLQASLATVFALQKPALSSTRSSRRSADAATYLAPTAWDEIRLAKPPVHTAIESVGTSASRKTTHGDAAHGHGVEQRAEHSGDLGMAGPHTAQTDPQTRPLSLNRLALFGQRPTDLISNPAFHLEDYNLASFSHQFKVRNPQLYQAAHRLTVNDRGEFVRQAIDPDTSTADFPFVADEMISFKRAGRPHELFVELDNRTEGNATQIQKVLNYIWYALEHPEKEIMMVLAIADGSVPTKQISQYGNIGRKLGNLATRLFRAYVPNTHHTHSQQTNLKGDDGHEEIVYLTDLYQQATNLSVRLTGVGEAHLDVAEFLLGSDYFLDYVSSVSRLVAHYNNRANDWQARFEPSAQYRSYVSQLPTRYGLKCHLSGTHLVNQKTRHNDQSKDHNSSSNGWPNSVFADPTLRNTPGDAASVTPQGTNQNTFGDEKCHPNSTQQHPLVHDTFDRWGTLVLTRQQSDYQRTQPILFGHEHSLDTLWHQYQLSTAPPALGLPTIPPITIYPHRERSVTAISLPEYRTMFNYPTTHAFQTPLLIQPYWGLTQNLQLQQELRWLIYQYQRDIIKYFQTGELNTSSSGLAGLPFNYLPCFDPLFGDGNAQASFFTGYGQSFNHRGWVSDGGVAEDGIYVDPLNTPPLSTIFAPMRSWRELHALLQVLSPTAFINQLRLDEVPLRLFQQLLHRWPKTAFSQPVIQPLAHWLSPHVVNHMDQLLQSPSLSLTYPSNLLPDSRLRPKI